MVVDKRKKIIDRIRKLLELADNNGATPAEAAAAALAAQRLIAENDVEQWEIYSDTEEPIEAVPASKKSYPRKWRHVLAAVVANAFRCRYYQLQERDWDAWAEGRHQKLHWCYGMSFYGYRTDATAAALTFDYLYRIGDRLATRYGREHFMGYNDFVLGYVSGIASELEKQSQALMIVVPPKVRDSYEKLTKDWVELDTDLSIRGDRCAYEEGFQEGKDTIRSHRIEKTKNEFLLEGVGA